MRLQRPLWVMAALGSKDRHCQDTSARQTLHHARASRRDPRGRLAAIIRVCSRNACSGHIMTSRCTNQMAVLISLELYQCPSSKQSYKQPQRVWLSDFSSSAGQPWQFTPHALYGSRWLSRLLRHGCNVHSYMHPAGTKSLEADLSNHNTLLRQSRFSDDCLGHEPTLRARKEKDLLPATNSHPSLLKNPRKTSSKSSSNSTTHVSKLNQRHRRSALLISVLYSLQRD